MKNDNKVLINTKENNNQPIPEVVVCRPRKSQSFYHSACTLIELLIVVFIIGMLATPSPYHNMKK